MHAYATRNSVCFTPCDVASFCRERNASVQPRKAGSTQGRNEGVCSPTNCLPEVEPGVPTWNLRHRRAIGNRPNSNCEDAIDMSLLIVAQEDDVLTSPSREQNSVEEPYACPYSPCSTDSFPYTTTFVEIGRILPSGNCRCVRYPLRKASIALFNLSPSEHLT